MLSRRGVRGAGLPPLLVPSPGTGLPRGCDPMRGLRRQDEHHRRTDRAPGHSHLPRRGRPGLTRSASLPPTPSLRPNSITLADPATPTLNALSASGDDCVPSSREVQLDHTSKARDRSQNLPRCCVPYVSNAKPLANPLPNPPKRPNPPQTRTPLPSRR